MTPVESVARRNNENEWIAVQDASDAVRQARGEVHAFAHTWRDAIQNAGEYKGLSAEFWLNSLRDAIDRERSACERLQHTHNAFMASIGIENVIQTKLSLSGKLVALLRAQPGRMIRELASELYGEGTHKNQGRTRALLAQLGRLGKIRNVGPGRWEAIP